MRFKSLAPSGDAAKSWSDGKMVKRFVRLSRVLTAASNAMQFMFEDILDWGLGKAELPCPTVGLGEAELPCPSLEQNGYGTNGFFNIFGSHGKGKYYGI